MVRLKMAETVADVSCESGLKSGSRSVMGDAAVSK
jgi:hypothetical protein